MDKPLSKKDLLAKLKALGPLPDDQRNGIVCTLIGHSRIKTECFGYWSCARCGSQIGDSLGGSYTGANDVIVGHDCEICRKNADTLSWRDKLFAPNPFAKD